MKKLRCVGDNLCHVIAVEEKTCIEQQVNDIERNWDSIAELCQRK